MAILVTALSWSIGRAGVSASSGPRAEPARETRASPLCAADRTIDGAIGLRLDLDPVAYQGLHAAHQAILTDFPLEPGRWIDLDVRRFDVFAPDARIVLGTPQGDVPIGRPDVVLLRGQVAGSADSSVFLALSPHGTNGSIRVDGRVFVVATPPAHLGADTVIYDWASVPTGAIAWRPWHCRNETLLAPLPGETPLSGSGSAQTEGRAAYTGALVRTVQMAIETDWEYATDVFGGDTDAAAAYAATLFGAASEIYMLDLDTQFEIVFLRFWATSEDPWDREIDYDQYVQFRDYWNSYMTHVDRHAVQFLSGRNICGGVAHLGGLCEEGQDYAIICGINGYFPYPLQDYDEQNWDIFVLVHELGHLFGAPHTDEVDPPIDTCGTCGTPTPGTIMSHCSTCPGGVQNIALHFHERIVLEYILPFLRYDVTCDLGVPQPACEVVGSPGLDAHVSSSRHLSLVGGNPDNYTAIRVVPEGLPPPHDALNGQVMWVGPPSMTFCENAGQDRPSDSGCPPAPGLGARTYRAAELQCEPYYRYWISPEPVHVFSEGIVPGGTYNVQAIERACAVELEEDYSVVLPAVTSPWGDAVGNCATTPCTPPDGVVNVTTDVTALLDKWKNLAGAPRKVRCDLEPALPDHVINITDVTYGLDAFKGFDYPFDVTPLCPEPPSTP
jgi:hypothetical protein